MNIVTSNVNRISVTLRRLIIFFFNDTATTEIYPLPLHGALPILGAARAPRARRAPGRLAARRAGGRPAPGGRLSALGSAPQGARRDRGARRQGDPAAEPPRPCRSEERRVGEEGRSRWSPYHLKKK